MDYQRFVSIVERWAQLDEERAQRAISATLQSLAERLQSGEAHKLAEQLPPELLGLLHTSGSSERMDVDAFLRRVSEREGVDVTTAEHHARAVFVALKQAITPDELAHLRAALPQDFAALLADVEPVAAETFFDRVARRAGLDRDGARRATDAVLETLAERIADGEVDDLIGQLAAPLHDPLKRGQARATATTRAMPVEQFVTRVAEREGVTVEEAVAHARAVLVTLREAIDIEEFFDVRVQLPRSYDVLFPDPAVVGTRDFPGRSSRH